MFLSNATFACGHNACNKMVFCVSILDDTSMLSNMNANTAFLAVALSAQLALMLMVCGDNKGTQALI